MQHRNRPFKNDRPHNGRRLLQWLVGLVAGLVLTVLPARRDAGRAGRMRKLDYGNNTQKMGLRFTERLRDVWRRRWLKLHR